MQIRLARLEQWMRDYYFSAEIDLGSSGVRSFSLGELRTLLDIDSAALDGVQLDDSHTLGAHALRAAIARRWSNGDPDMVMATHGSSEALLLVMRALLSPGDEVVAVAPAYQQLHGIAESIGCTLRTWSLDAAVGFAPDIADLRRALTPGTRMVIVNFPHNPTGVTLTPAEQRQLVDVVAEANAYLLWDAAFGDLAYDDDPLPFPNHLYSRSLSVGTLSKAYGLPGLRVGWLVAEPDVLEQCVRWRDFTTLHASPLVEVIAERAVLHGDRLLRPRLTDARQNRAALDRWVNENRPFVSWRRPSAGVCGLLHLHGIGPAVDFCRDVAQHQHVLLVPGECFGLTGCARLGFGASPTAFDTGLARVSASIAQCVTAQ